MLDIAAIKPHLEPFLDRLLRVAGFDLTFSIRSGSAETADAATTPPEIVVDFSGPDTDLLLQHGAELLRALEYLAVRYLRLRPEEQVRFAFDCQDYDTMRLEELRLTARTAAEQVERTGMPLALNPMDARERRIVHLELRENPAVRTESQGFGPHRRVVISPAEKKSGPRP